MTPEQSLRRVKEEAERATEGPWTHSPQDGAPGNCFVAQVWDSQGRHLCAIETTPDEEIATRNAVFIAAARINVPRLVRWVELQRAVIEAWEVFFADDSDPQARDNLSAATEALSAFEKEMETWT